MNTMLVKGNQALAEGAIRGGCRFYAGYPITPQSEILEWMSYRQEELNGACIQGESEVASINMVFSACATGARAMTSSSGAGFSLKQEGIAYMVAAELPTVIACVQRFGIGDGYIGAGQDNYWQAVKGGGNGDYRLIVLAPNSPQECADMAYESFALAEKWRHPILLLSDATIGQMIEPVTLKDYVEHDINQPWAAKGTPLGSGRHKVVTDVSYYEDLDEWNAKYMKKMRQIQQEEQRWESFYVEDADVVLVAYGISARAAEAAVVNARKEGLKIGLIRPITLWPYPRKAFKEIPDTCKGIVTVEANMMGQMREEIIVTTNGKFRTYSLATAQRVATRDQIIQFAKDVMDNKIEEDEVF